MDLDELYEICYECTGYGDDYYTERSRKMRKEILICDVCKRQVTPDKHFAFKVKSEAFVNYQNYDTFGANKRKFDICEGCLEAIGEAVRKGAEHDNL